jgi:hypothetical protein
MEARTARILERTTIVTCGLVPLVGLVFFGWSLAAVIFTFWFDAFLASLRMIPVNLYFLNRDIAPNSRYLGQPGLVYLAIVCWMFLAVPVWVAGIHLDKLVSQFHPGGFDAQARYLMVEAPWWFAVMVGGRLFQCVREFAVARAAGPARFVDMVKALFAHSMFKGVVLFTLSGIATWFGFFGLRGPELFVAMTAAGLIAVEWNADRLFPTRRPDAVPLARKPLEIVHGFDARDQKPEKDRVSSAPSAASPSDRPGA